MKDHSPCTQALFDGTVAGIQACEPARAGPDGWDTYLWVREALEAVAALGKALRSEPGEPLTATTIFRAALPALRSVAGFQTLALLLVERDGVGFQLVDADPPHALEAVRAEVAHQAGEGNFGWALFQDRPVLVPGESLGKWILLHAVSTPSGVLGMLIGSLDEEAPFIPELGQRVLSILLQSCGGVLEAEALHRELAERNRNLEELVDRRTRELRRSEEEARSASRAKSEFLANMSHEIRTPVHGVLGALSLLGETDLEPDQREYVRVATRSARNLLGIVDDILDFSKIESGRLVLEHLPFDLREVVEEVMETVAPQASEKRLDFLLHYPLPEPHRFVGDAGRLRQILLNLVGNAVKFTHDGRVLVEVRTGGKGEGGRVWMIFRVEDTGIGIPPEDLERIFEKFQQGDGSTTRRYGGTGLGLAISRQLTHLMGGTIEVRSAPGLGSVFTVQLPLAPQGGEPLPRLASWEGCEEIQALVVAPDEACREVLWGVLGGVGLRVTGTTSLEGACRLLAAAVGRGRPVRLVVVDDSLSVPPLSQAVEILRQAAGDGDTVFVAAVRGGKASASKGFESHGLHLILPKPLLLRHLEPLRRLLCPSAAPRPGQALEEAHRTEAMGVSPWAGTGRRALVVEDDEVARKVLVAMLEKLGLTCAAAEDGARALQVLKQESFDLVFMDCQMPEMDGFQTTAALRSLEGGKGRVPVIALTAGALPGDRERCLAAGMNDYLSKPMTLSQLRGALARWLPCEETAAGPFAPEVSPIWEEPVFDADAAFRRAGESWELLREVGKIFLEDWAGQHREMREAVARRDRVALGRSAHRLKGSALHLSAGRVAEVAGQLESMALQDRLEQADPVIEELAAAVAAFEQVFQRSFPVVEGLQSREVTL